MPRALASIQLYASGASDPSARRPVDGLRAVCYLLLLLVTAVLSEIGRDLDERLSSVLRSFPGFLRVLWLCGFWTAVGWTIALLAIARISRSRAWGQRPWPW